MALFDRRSQPTAFYAMQIMGSREEQEDSYGLCYHSPNGVDKNPTWFILADGMGGHIGGGVASQTVIDAVKLVMEGCNEINEFTLREALASANHNISECLKINPEFKGMGTTLVVLVIFEQKAFWVSVGDSPLLTFNDSHQVEQLNEDHSMRPILKQLSEAGEVNGPQHMHHGRANQLRSAITGKKIDLYDLNADGVCLKDSKYLLLSSDGLDTLSREEVQEIMISESKKGPKVIANRLIDAVLAKGSPKQDNATLIVVDPRLIGVR